MYEMQGPRLVASRTSSDCSVVGESSYQYRLVVLEPVSVAAALRPDLGLLPDLESVLAVDEFLPPPAPLAQEVSANISKILFYLIMRPAPMTGYCPLSAPFLAATKCRRSGFVCRGDNNHSDQAHKTRAAPACMRCRGRSLA